ncbi:hypothetical protein FO519_001653 [Halicephalobus sp. NKZ332]|nr:hypothetical protein FO519_001653 [Halicephalobus sp. NKZ332]
MLKLVCLLLLAFSIAQVLSLECYTGYSLIRGQTVGTTTQKCTKSSDQCYKAKADISTLNKFKLAGCSTFRCMLSRNKCQTQQVAGQTIELCCCNDRDLCNGADPNSPTSTLNNLKNSLLGGALKTLTASASSTLIGPEDEIEFIDGIIGDPRIEDTIEGSGEYLDDDPEHFHPPDHYRLEHYLKTNYNSRVVPRRNSNETVNVSVKMEIYQIVEMNEPQQYILLNTWIVERWNDDLLYWNPARFGGLRQISLPKDAVWLPDTTLYNSLVMDEAESRKLINVKITTLPKEKTTLVELLYPTLYKTSCLLDLRTFPFDLQSCKLTFGSWTHDNKAINYFPHNVSGKSAISTKHCIENEEWNILGTKVVRLESKFDCCVNNYTLLEFHVHLQRKPLYYVINLITPTAIITLIAIFGFFSSSTINDVREEKMSLGITTLLSMSILIFMVSDKMPNMGTSVPLIGWYYTSCITLISTATLAASIVIFTQKKGIVGKRPSRKTMRWARRLGKILMVRMPLLMVQAYALKAKARQSLKHRTQKKNVIAFECASMIRRVPLGEEDSGSGPLPQFLETEKYQNGKYHFWQDKMRKASQRKVSVWQRWYKLSKDVRKMSIENANTVKPMSNREPHTENNPMSGPSGPAGLNIMTGPSDEVGRKINFQQGNTTEMSNILGNNNSTAIRFMDDDNDTEKMSDDEKSWDAPSQQWSNGVDNVGFQPSRSISLASAAPYNTRKPLTNHNSLVEFDLVDGVFDFSNMTALQQRTLAQIEWDWIAAVIERAFLVFFNLCFWVSILLVGLIGVYCCYYMVDLKDSEFTGV